MIQGNACKINKLIINKLIIDANLMIQSTISLLDKNDRELANVSNIIIPSTETLNKIEELFKCIELDAAKEIFENVVYGEIMKQQPRDAFHEVS
jgi:hypothetical protein